MALKILGGLWRKKNKEGVTYFSGQMEYIAGQKVNIVVMPYKPRDPSKISSKSPAYTILLNVPDTKKMEDNVKFERSSNDDD